MSDVEPMKTAATYALAWTVSAAVGAAIAGAGVVYWVLPAYSWYLRGQPPVVVLRIAAPGIALLLVGALVWKLGSTLARYRTLGSVVAADTAERLDVEAMKSDILSVMDERLADLKQDTQQTRRVVERQSRDDAAEEFQFSGDGPRE